MKAKWKTKKKQVFKNDYDWTKLDVSGERIAIFTERIQRWGHHMNLNLCDADSVDDDEDST